MKRLLYSLLICLFFLPFSLLAADTNITPQMNVPIPFINITDNVAQGSPIPWISDYITGLYTLSYTVAGLLAIIMILLGGFLWASSAGNQNQVGKGKEMITSAIAGIVVILCSYLILYLIGGARLTTITELTATKIYTTEERNKAYEKTIAERTPILTKLRETKNQTLLASVKAYDASAKTYEDLKTAKLTFDEVYAKYSKIALEYIENPDDIPTKQAYEQAKLANKQAASDLTAAENANRQAYDAYLKAAAIYKQAYDAYPETAASEQAEAEAFDEAFNRNLAQ
ncbi:MAG: Uncharacterized protein G01um101418_346 [Parcubacteria group bacterium Gr01-1014_18]|nr:MAG: Uncharacterized protein Greene041636_278 [Parcubacteria group bacterium Greene0416_36]TSC81206.1 MAG: Uncharacterized protein G01um101418_346 [Parcubacteria group bacterium Gr01-1014_18]TSC99203.1 MAG: Uncharacterized protein Greene101420_348 [Parcubacteria group bacterium Greene1014_20]TSD07439.1 MAG: Uncharacterized protein Greene07142_138 [Parcubacteria group bacterium Greene0714_2]